jgi:hypothetical protein
MPTSPRSPRRLSGTPAKIRSGSEHQQRRDFAFVALSPLRPALAPRACRQRTPVFADDDAAASGWRLRRCGRACRQNVPDERSTSRTMVTCFPAEMRARALTAALDRNRSLSTTSGVAAAAAGRPEQRPHQRRWKSTSPRSVSASRSIAIRATPAPSRSHNRRRLLRKVERELGTRLSRPTTGGACRKTARAPPWTGSWPLRRVTADRSGQRVPAGRPAVRASSVSRGASRSGEDRAGKDEISGEDRQITGFPRRTERADVGSSRRAKRITRSIVACTRAPRRVADSASRRRRPALRRAPARWLRRREPSARVRGSAARDAEVPERRKTTASSSPAATTTARARPRRRRSIARRGTLPITRRHGQVGSRQPAPSPPGSRARSSPGSETTSGWRVTVPW